MAKTKWKNKFYVDIYRLAAQGMTDSEIAKTLGISAGRIAGWKEEKPTVKYAMEQARDKKSSVEDYIGYVYDKLPDNLKQLWDKIRAVEDEPNAIRRMEAMLTEGGKYARMHLFLYALTASNFNPSRALSAVNIRLKELKNWVHNEPGFADLMDEMKEHKKNFAEEALFKLVRKGDPNAVIFVNKTLNKDRGYADNKQVVEHIGKIDHTHEHRHLIDLDKLNLTFEVRKAILEAVRLKRKEEMPALEYKMNGKRAVPVDDVEVKETNDE